MNFCLPRVIIYDVFTPPVACRIYVYSSLASYEALRYSKPKCSFNYRKAEWFQKNAGAGEGKEI
jgi:hypothetical protein